MFGHVCSCHQPELSRFSYTGVDIWLALRNVLDIVSSSLDITNNPRNAPAPRILNSKLLHAAVDRSRNKVRAEHYCANLASTSMRHHKHLTVVRIRWDQPGKSEIPNHPGSEFSSCADLNILYPY
jgi:hypothetical protein